MIWWNFYLESEWARPFFDFWEISISKERRVVFGWTLKDSRLGVDWTLPFPSEFFSLLITADNHRNLTRVEFELSTFFLGWHHRFGWKQWTLLWFFLILKTMFSFCVCVFPIAIDGWSSDFLWIYKSGGFFLLLLYIRQTTTKKGGDDGKSKIKIKPFSIVTGCCFGNQSDHSIRFTLISAAVYLSLSLFFLRLPSIYIIMCE